MTPPEAFLRARCRKASMRQRRMGDGVFDRAEEGSTGVGFVIPDKIEERSLYQSRHLEAIQLTR